jgi:alpha-galactosidase
MGVAKGFIGRASLAVYFAIAFIAIAGGASAPPARSRLISTLTPPMGWNPWYAYGCDVNEALIEQTARLIVADGYAAAGYHYINLDDCWMAAKRTKSGQLQPDPTKFPHGIAALAAYVHGLGLGLGMYLDAGKQTCMKFPGSQGHIQQDAATLASWGVDFVKVDYCNTGLPPPKPVYDRIYAAFQSVSQPMILSICDWGYQRPWQWAPAIATMWRTTHDYDYYLPVNFWKATLTIANLNSQLARYAHPGAWNDPDLLLAGTGKLTVPQERAQMSLWSVMAAPLLMDANLTSVAPASAATLTNPEVIAVDQDKLGIQGGRLGAAGPQQRWLRRMADGSRVVVLFNSSSQPASISIDLTTIGLPKRSSYIVRDLWAHTTATVGPAVSQPVSPDDVVMLRVWPGPPDAGTSPAPATGGVAPGQ